MERCLGMEPRGLAGPVKAGAREEAGRWHHHNGYSRPRRAGWKVGSVTGQGGLQLDFGLRYSIDILHPIYIGAGLGLS